MLDDILTRIKNASKTDHAAIAIKECGESLVEVGNNLRATPFWLDNDTLIHDVEGRFYDAYKKKHPEFALMVREDVLKRLLLAQSYLPHDWKLVICAGWRPLEVQSAMFDDYVQQIADNHSDWNLEDCVAYTEQYISNPQKTVPPHVTAGAVDVNVYDAKHQALVDMGGKICELNESSHCFNKQLNDAQYSNQARLIEAMCRAGFAPFATEWWHFSYGDQRWASFYGKEAAVYGKPSDINDK